MKLLLVLVAAAGAALGISRVRAGRDEADLWHEATTPGTPARPVVPPS